MLMNVNWNMMNANRYVEIHQGLMFVDAILALLFLLIEEVAVVN